MRRSLFAILCVALLSAWIARIERSGGIPHTPRAAKNGAEWVRTTVGWERRAALFAAASPRPTGIHPALIATLELSASLLVLLAFPSQAGPARKNPGLVPAPARRRTAVELAASR